MLCSKLINYLNDLVLRSKLHVWLQYCCKPYADRLAKLNLNYGNVSQSFNCILVAFVLSDEQYMQIERRIVKVIVQHTLTIRMKYNSYLKVSSRKEKNMSQAQ